MFSSQVLQCEQTGLTLDSTEFKTWLSKRISVPQCCVCHFHIYDARSVHGLLPTQFEVITVSSLQTLLSNE